MIVDGNEVTWVGATITATSIGANTYILPAPAGVTAGSYIGVWSGGSAGVIPFSRTTAGDQDVSFTNGGEAKPVIGTVLTYQDLPEQENRTYSMQADVEASSPDICRNGGWEAYEYKNQGQCIASIVANENAGRA